MEAAIRHGEVGIRVAPTSQPALRVKVLPERRVMEIGCIYLAIRVINARKRKVDDDLLSNSNMVIHLYIRTCSLVPLRRRVRTSGAMEGIDP